MEDIDRMVYFWGVEWNYYYMSKMSVKRVVANIISRFIALMIQLVNRGAIKPPEVFSDSSEHVRSFGLCFSPITSKKKALCLILKLLRLSQHCGYWSDSAGKRLNLLLPLFGVRCTLQFLHL